MSCNASLRMWSSAEASPADLRPLRQCSSFTPSAPHCCSGYPGISAAALQARCMTYCRSLMTRFQLMVAVEIALHLVRDIGGSTRFRALLCLLLLGTASVFTWIALVLLPHRIPTDRLQLFAWFAMLALFGAILKGTRSPNLTRISAGLAAFSLVQFSALAGRAVAFHNRNTAQYAACHTCRPSVISQY